MLKQEIRSGLAGVALLLALLAAFHAGAQMSTGTISGTVADPSGNIIPKATVALLNEQTGEVRTTGTNELGLFLFAAVPPGTYTVRVEFKGFRTFERKGQVLIASDRLSLGTVTLQVGELTEKVTVTAEGAVVQTASSENSQLLTSIQMDQIQSKARDVVALLRILPGVALTGGWADTDSLGGTFGSSTPNIGGARRAWNSPSLDGQSTSNPFDQSLYEGITSLDAVSEAKVLQNNYQAEYGRSSGAFINFISKSGTRDFHGNVYWFKRHEQFNATDFFNNRNSVRKPLYRYDNYGGTIGGPIYIPGKFNQEKDKLFFFFAAERWKVSEPRSVWRVTVPTDLERGGDFSKTVELNGALIPIKDPTTGKPFENNVIPASRINKNTQALMKLFPQPNFFDRSISGGNYNYVFQEITDQPKMTKLLKGDYNASSKDRLSVRYQNFWSDRKGYQSLAAFNSNWPQFKHHYKWPSTSFSANYNRTFSPTVLNEFGLGYHTSAEDGALTSAKQLDPVSRPTTGVNIGQLYPAGNPYKVIPQASFGGVPSAANISYDDRLPINAKMRRWEFRDNVSMSRGAHLFKMGLLFERNWNDKGLKGNFGGSFSFAKDTNNPSDANYAYANALLGNFASYTEASQRVSAPVTHFLSEWFAQDTWKVTRRLTLDHGVRFSWATPYRYTNGNAGAFALERYDITKAPVLIRPAKDASGKRVAVNPLTGQFMPTVFIGSFAPNSGDINNGLLTSADATYPKGFRNAAPVQVAPRFGFAYDVFGDGKTAVRGGFGITKQMALSAHEMVWNNLTHPPVVWNPTIWYGNVDTFLNASGVLFPSGVQMLEKDPTIPSLYSYSLTIQRDLGLGTVLSVGYVGNTGRHLEQSRNLNTVPYGARFKPENADPANPSTWLPDNFFRPYPGYGNLTYVENSGTSNYNGLQVSANRRFTKGLQFGALPTS